MASPKKPRAPVDVLHKLAIRGWETERKSLAARLKAGKISEDSKAMAAVDLLDGEERTRLAKQLLDKTADPDQKYESPNRLRPTELSRRLMLRKKPTKGELRSKLNARWSLLAAAVNYRTVYCAPSEAYFFEQLPRGKCCAATEAKVFAELPTAVEEEQRDRARLGSFGEEQAPELLESLRTMTLWAGTVPDELLDGLPADATAAVSEVLERLRRSGSPDALAVARAGLQLDLGRFLAEFAGDWLEALRRAEPVASATPACPRCWYLRGLADGMDQAGHPLAAETYTGGNATGPRSPVSAAIRKLIADGVRTAEEAWSRLERWALTRHSEHIAGKELTFEKLDEELRLDWGSKSCNVNRQRFRERFAEQFQEAQSKRGRASRSKRR